LLSKYFQRICALKSKIDPFKKSIILLKEEGTLSGPMTLNLNTVPPKTLFEVLEVLLKDLCP